MAADRTCPKCGSVFAYPWKLKRHQQRKTSCEPILDANAAPDAAHKCRYCGRAFTTQQALSRHTLHRCKIANSEEGMEKLFEHTLQRQLAEQKLATEQQKLAAEQQKLAAERQSAKVDALQAQVAELATLLKGQLAGAPRPAGAAIERAVVVNAGPTTNIAQQTNNVQVTQNIIQILPWDGDRRISVDAGQIAAAFAENGRLKEYAGWSDHEMVDPDRAPPYVAELYVDLTKRAHADPSARNVYLNPRRSDQALVHMAGGKWEVLPLGETTRLLFDGITADLRRVTLTATELKQLPAEAQNAVSMAKLMYQGEPEEYVVRAKGPMSAHLVNTAPAVSSA